MAASRPTSAGLRRVTSSSDPHRPLRHAARVRPTLPQRPTGALFALTLVYRVYDFTNYSTLRQWPLVWLALTQSIAWGAAASAACAAAPSVIIWTVKKPRDTQAAIPDPRGFQKNGVAIDTLRTWEHRHSAVMPIRDDRGRMYTDARHAAASVARCSGTRTQHRPPCTSERFRGCAGRSLRLRCKRGVQDQTARRTPIDAATLTAALQKSR